MCLNETYSRVRVGKHLSDMFPIKNGLKLNSAHQLLVDADGINVLGGSVRTMQKNTEALVVASKDIGLEVNADRTKCMVIVSRSECRTKSQYGDW